MCLETALKSKISFWTIKELYGTEGYHISGFGYHSCKEDEFIAGLALQMKFVDDKKNIENCQLYPFKNVLQRALCQIGSNISALPSIRRVLYSSTLPSSSTNNCHISESLVAQGWQTIFIPYSALELHHNWSSCPHVCTCLPAVCERARKIVSHQDTVESSLR